MYELWKALPNKRSYVYVTWYSSVVIMLTVNMSRVTPLSKLSFHLVTFCKFVTPIACLSVSYLSHNDVSYSLWALGSGDTKLAILKGYTQQSCTPTNSWLVTYKFARFRP